MNFVAQFFREISQNPMGFFLSKPGEVRCVTTLPTGGLAFGSMETWIFWSQKHWFSPQVVLNFVDFKLLDHLKNPHRFPLFWPVIFANWAKIIRKYHPIKAPKNEPPRSLVKTLPRM